MVVRDQVLGASEDVLSTAEGDAVASSSGNIPPEPPATTDNVHSVINDDSLPPSATLSPENDAFAVGNAEQEVVLAAVPAHGQQATTATASTSPTEGTGSVPGPSTQDAPTAESRPESHTASSEVKLPIDHTYYFIQMFDADNQVLRTVGSFFSKLDANVKASIRHHLQRPLRQDFLLWKRVDGAAVTTVSPADSFKEVVAPHGICFIVGEKLTKDK
jgi:hypothetical protein